MYLIQSLLTFLPIYASKTDTRNFDVFVNRNCFFFSMSEKHIKFSNGISLLNKNYFPNLILNHKWIIKFERSPTGDFTGLSHPVAGVTPERASTQHSIVYKSLPAAALSFGHIPKICGLK